MGVKATDTAWRADVGLIDHGQTEFFLILGQIGSFDQFSVPLNRRLLTVVLGSVDDAP